MNNQISCDETKLSLVGVLIFSIVFVGGGLLLRHYLLRDIYFANFPIWDVKYQFLINANESPEVIALGNSHIYRELSPHIIENKLHEANDSGGVLNMGVPSLSVVELPLLLDIIETLPQKPKYIIVDPFLNTGSMDNWSTIRAIKNHDQKNFEYLANFDWYIFGDNQGVLKSLIKVGYHLLSFLCNTFNVGMLNKFVYEDQYNYMRVTEKIPNMLTDKGFVSLDDESENETKNRKKNEYQQVNKKVNHNIEFNKKYIDFFEVVNDRIISMGSTPIFISTPVMSYKEALRRQAMREQFLVKYPKAIFLDYSMLFIENEYRNSDIWFDSGHLARKGANMFSQQLANDVAKLSE